MQRWKSPIKRPLNLFLIHFSKCPSFSNIQSCVPNVSLSIFFPKFKSNFLVKSVLNAVCAMAILDWISHVHLVSSLWIPRSWAAEIAALLSRTRGCKCCQQLGPALLSLLAAADHVALLAAKRWEHSCAVFTGERLLKRCSKREVDGREAPGGSAAENRLWTDFREIWYFFRIFRQFCRGISSFIKRWLK